MNLLEDHEVYDMAREYYGLKREIDQFVEECAELIVALGN